MEKVSPTRMNLLSRKSQHGFACEGVELLKHKREVLLSKFMDLVKPLMDKHDLLHSEMVRAFHCLNTARGIDGWRDLESAALLLDKKVSIEVSKESSLGVEIPKIEAIEGFDARFQGPHSHSISLRIYETRDRFEKVIQLIFEIAPLEAALKRLGREIQKTTRRINALEVMLIPRLRNEIRYIRSTLEEMERENNFRLRSIAKKKELEKQ